MSLHQDSTLAPHDGLEDLRRTYMTEIAAAVRRGRLVRVAPYVLASSVEERQADLFLIERYTIAAGIALTTASFSDPGQPPPIGERSGWRAARQYAEQGYAHGIVAIARSALTTEPAAYAALLNDLFAHQLFLALLSAED